METAIILIQCPDQKGIIAKISNFVFTYEGNIIKSDQYSTDPDGGIFFMRIEFCFDPERLPPRNLESAFAALAQSLGATWELHYASRKVRMAIAVSKYDHCLLDLLYRVRIGELPVAIPCVVSNHEDLRTVVESYGIPFHHLPVTQDTKSEQESAILDLIKDESDLLVLARYMQILSDDFITAYGKDIVNIHHSFLPSFKGANPYRQAYERGVKIIGATAHYATASLDEGPIIAQAVEPVSHNDNVESLKRKGRHLELIALASAIRSHCEHRIIRFENKTIVFS